MKFFHPFAALGLAAALSVSASALAFELDHSDGTLRLDQAPQRVVSFDLGHLDTLNALDIPVVGVPVSVYSGSLADFSDTPTVGTLFEPDYAALRQQEPDLIIAGGRSAGAMPQLAEVAPTVSFAHDPANFLDSVRDSSLAIGKAWGKQSRAQVLYDDLQNSVQELHAINKGRTGALLFVIRDNVIAHAPGDRFGYVYELTGLEPVLPARGPQELGQPRPEPGTPEAQAAALKRAQDVTRVAKADPDWLIILDRGAINDGEKTAAATLAAHPELAQTTAVRENRVYYADPNGWYVVTGGLHNLKAITDDMARAMQ